MENPPPLPPASVEQDRRLIQRAQFVESKSMRLGHVTFDYSLIEASHQKAEAWMNQNPDIEIVQIQTFHSSLSGITVVWYRA
ncbi:hypothetical protein NT6N_00250 [Oceaniferula spumae]|uniref:Uncharacterized protein n=1 Tax=Oceaniferula spumae TaxID=2979115 RepID=A0AAT9FG81_9BACT